MAKRRVELGTIGHDVRCNIRTARRERGLTLRDLAVKLADGEHALAHNTLSEIETGARRIDVDDLVAIATGLDLPPNALLAAAEPQEESLDDLLRQLETLTRRCRKAARGDHNRA